MKINILKLNEPTKNGHVYSKEIIETALDDPILKEKLTSKMFFVVFEPGLSNHCCINTLDICGVVHNFELTNTELNADIELIDTPKGRIVQQLINNNHAYYGYTIGAGKIYSMNTVIDYDLDAIGIAFI